MALVGIAVHTHRRAQGRAGSQRPLATHSTQGLHRLTVEARAELAPLLAQAGAWQGQVLPLCAALPMDGTFAIDEGNANAPDGGIAVLFAITSLVAFRIAAHDARSAEEDAVAHQLGEALAYRLSRWSRALSPTSTLVPHQAAAAAAGRFGGLQVGGLVHAAAQAFDPECREYCVEDQAPHSSQEASLQSHCVHFIWTSTLTLNLTISSGPVWSGGPGRPQLRLLRPLSPVQAAVPPTF